MAQVLLYNITDREKLLKIKLSLLKLGVSFREVRPEEYAHPVGYLLGREGHSPEAAPVTAEPFTGEMLLMDGLSGPLFSGFLDSLRAQHAQVALKAVATEHNVHWSSQQLYRELRQEHLSMSRAVKKSVHRKRR